MKKFFASALGLTLLVCLAACNIIRNPAVQEYTPGHGNIKGNVDTADFYERDARFEIGATKNGYAVFKSPYDAYTALTENYSSGLELIRSEFNLEPVTRSNYEMYLKYGMQVTTGSAEAQEQARFVSSFFDIYENSFE